MDHTIKEYQLNKTNYDYILVGQNEIQLGCYKPTQSQTQESEND